MKKGTILKYLKDDWGRAKIVLREKGFYYVIRVAIQMFILNYSLFPYYVIFKKKTFSFNNKKYNYFYNSYKTTWANERAIEIPLVWEIVKKYLGKNVLEVGNVLSHYFDVKYDILDKYEKAEGVINQDIVDFNPPKKYDIIVSISTLEHVGFEEVPKDPVKILRAFEQLDRLLAKGGKIVVTLPMCYNPYLDDLLKKRKIKFTEMHCFKKVSSNNNWEEVEFKDIQNIGYSVFSARGLILGIIKK